MKENENELLDLDEEGNIKIYGQCTEQLEDFENSEDIGEICLYYSDTPIKSINNLDPFEYINNFGGNFLSTKNVHGTFSFKLRYHNNVPLSDYPLSLEELQNYEAEFISGESFKTEYLIISDVDIDNDDNDRLRNLNGNNSPFFSSNCSILNDMIKNVNAYIKVLKS